MARNLVKSCFVFMLLDRGGIAIADVPGYLGRVGLYRDINVKFFKLAPDDYAAMIVDELERVGAVRREGGLLVPR